MQGLISNLIRPFRFRYSIFDLGPRITDRYLRKDQSILNDRGYRIQYSYYQNKNKSSTCLIYAHCNSGSRIEGMQFIQPVMQQGWNLCVFDFVGSGISQGQYISLGHYESMDLETIVSVVLREGNSAINLWGRSMGAATIILYLSQTKQIQNICSCVLDSPYSSLWSAIIQFGKSKTKIPQFIIEHLMEYIRKTILKNQQFDIKQIDLLKKITKIQIPVMFIASTNDSFVSHNHASQLYKLSASSHKVLQYIQKEHNSPRQHNTMLTGFTFMAKNLKQNQNNKKIQSKMEKKKQFCRKLTGKNMAQLITKVPKKNILNKQSFSTGNLTKFNSYFSKNANSSQQLNSQNLQKSVKNPHKIQESIIKLRMPPHQIFEQIQMDEEETNILKQLESSEIAIKFNKTIQNRNKQALYFEKDQHKHDKQNNRNASNKQTKTKAIKSEKNQTLRRNTNEQRMHSLGKTLDNSNTIKNNGLIYKQEEKKKIKMKIKINCSQNQEESGQKKKSNKVCGIKLMNKNNLNKSQNCKAIQIFARKNSQYETTKVTRQKQRTKTQNNHYASMNTQYDWKESTCTNVQSEKVVQKICKNDSNNKNWVCQDSICELYANGVQNHTAQIFINKYSDEQVANPATAEIHKNQSIVEKTRLKQDKQKQQRVINIKIDPKQLTKMKRNDEQKGNKKLRQFTNIQDSQIKISIPRIQINAINSKMKGKTKKYIKTNLAGSKNKSFL